MAHWNSESAAESETAIDSGKRIGRRKSKKKAAEFGGDSSRHEPEGMNNWTEGGPSLNPSSSGKRTGAD